jgi:hypothetical protein
MLLFAQAGAGQLVESALHDPEQSPLLTAYGLRSNDGSIKVAVFNKNLDDGIRLTIASGPHIRRATALRLHAPRVDDTTDTTFGGAPVGAGAAWSAAHEETLTVENGTVTVELPETSASLVMFYSG